MKRSLGYAGLFVVCASALQLSGIGCSSDEDGAGDGGPDSSSSSGGSSSSSSSSSSGGGSSSSSSSSSGGSSSSSGGSSSGDGGSSSGDGGATCTALTLGADYTLTGNDAEEHKYALFAGTFTPQLYAPNEFVSVELAIDDSLGSFDMSEPAQQQYATCTRCLVVHAGADETEKYFLTNSGVFEVTALSFVDGTVQGTVRNAKLIEVEIAQDGSSTPVPNGACLTIAEAVIDAPTE